MEFASEFSRLLFIKSLPFWEIIFSRKLHYPIRVQCGTSESRNYKQKSASMSGAARLFARSEESQNFFNYAVDS